MKPKSLLSKGQRKFVLDCVERTEHLPGDIVELGVSKGGTTWEIAEKLKELNSHRRIWAVDSFDFWRESSEQDRWEGGFRYKKTPLTDLCRIEYREAYPEALRMSLIGHDLYPWVIIVEGWFEDILRQRFRKFDEFSLVIIDCDQYRGTKIAIEFFWPKLNGILLADDYTAPQIPGVKMALDEYLNEELKEGAGTMYYKEKMNE